MSDYKKDLIDKLKNNSSLICIIGLGYVGLPLALNFCEKKYKVLGLDIDEQKINKINSGISFISYIQSSRIKNAIDNKNLEVSSNISLVKKAQAIILCVPTPLTKHNEPDLSYINQTLESILPHLQKGQVLSLESTTYPGTTEEIVKPFIEKGDFKIGSDFFLVYSPEREDPGNKEYNTCTIPKILGGITNSCKEVGEELYKKTINEVVTVSDTKVAEMTKLLENIHRAVNIGLINELKVLSDKMNIDLYEVIDAASTKPFGFVPYYPGPGLGGHCIPIDPFYLTWKAKEFGMHTRFIELAGEINTYMPYYVLEKTSDLLNEHGLAIKGSKILILGVAYKRNVDDMRESPSLAIMQLLKNKGAYIEYSDPFIPEIPKLRKFSFQLKSILVTEKTLKEFDLVLLLTDHDKFNYDLIEKNSTLIIDTRGRYKPNEKIYRS
tara:strand:+ start:594 stop:1907 length:1314 start_codon:yes stop_codon:yes gene_type:complete